MKTKPSRRPGKIRRAAGASTASATLHLKSIIPHERSAPFTFHSQSVFLQPPIEDASAQPERLGGPLRIALKTGQRLLDEKPLHCFQVHVLDPIRAVACGSQTQAPAVMTITGSEQSNAWSWPRRWT